MIEILNNNYFPNRNGLQPHYVIIHGTAGGTSAQAVANYFVSTQGTANPVSSHYVIGQDGMIVQCVAEKDGAWGNGLLTPGHDAWWNESINPNLITISIEHVKASTDNSDALTEPQKQASFQLIKDICQRWNIPMRIADASGGITGHFSIDPVSRRNCPGSYPWVELWAYLKGTPTNMSTNIVPAGWQDNGSILIAPNGHKVVQGFRDYVLANNWDAGNEPQEDEVHVEQLELFSGGTHAAGQRQLFRDCMLIWTAANGVQRSYIGMELQSYYQLIHSQNQQIVQLAAQIHALSATPPKYDVAQILSTLQSLETGINAAQTAVKVLTADFQA